MSRPEEGLSTARNKTKSLTYSNKHAIAGEHKSNWDMEVIFRKNRALRGRGKVDPRIFPSIGGDMNYGRIIEPDEIEVKDDKLFHSGPEAGK